MAKWLSLFINSDEEHFHDTGILAIVIFKINNCLVYTSYAFVACAIKMLTI